jgi:CubicO group peptidase (beta-lactamase class C family)
MLDKRGALGLDQPLGDQLDHELLHRWKRFPDLPETTPRQLLSHTAGLPSYFDPQFVARAAADPGRRWEPVELADQALMTSLPLFEPGRGFSYSDTGYVLTGILIERRTRQALHAVCRNLVFDPAGMESTWLEGHEPPRHPRIAHHYAGDLDMASVSPTIDWAGGGLVSTTADLSRFLTALWSGRLIDSTALQELTRWTPGASFPPGHGLRYDRYGLGLGSIQGRQDRAPRPHRIPRRVRLLRASIRRNPRGHPQRVGGEPLASGRSPLLRATRLVARQSVTSKLNIMPLSWCSARWQWAIQRPGLVTSRRSRYACRDRGNEHVGPGVRHHEWLV